jgi:hypothetical protein
MLLILSVQRPNKRKPTKRSLRIGKESTTKASIVAKASDVQHVEAIL